MVVGLALLVLSNRIHSLTNFAYKIATTTIPHSLTSVSHHKMIVKEEFSVPFHDGQQNDRGNRMRY